MHVRVRAADGEERVVVLVSRLSAVQELRRAVRDKFSVPPDNQRLFYGGKLLENGYNLHDYSIKLNDVIQLMVRSDPQAQQDQQEDGKNSKNGGRVVYEDVKSNLYAVGDLIDMRDKELGAWFEGTILRIVRDPEYRPSVKSTTLNGGPTTQNGGPTTLNGGPTSPKSKKMTNGKTDSANDSRPSTPKEVKIDRNDTECETRVSPRKNGKIDSKQATPKSGKKYKNITERTSCDTQVSSPKTNGKVDSKLSTPKSVKKDKNDTEKPSCDTQAKTNGKIDSKLATPKSGKKGKKNTSISSENSVSSPKINGETAKTSAENETSPNTSTSSPKTPNRKRGITDYFSKTPKSSKKPEEKPNLTDNDVNDAENDVNDAEHDFNDAESGHSVENDDDVDSDTDVGVLYKINLVYDDIKEETSHYCKPNEIRPRARRAIPVEQLTIGSTVMVNHNTEDAYEKGYWYDFIVLEVLKQRKSYELIGTLFLGSECIPQNDTKIRVLDNIYAIEEVVPTKKRTEEYSKLITTPTEQRALPIICTTCRDNEKRSCRECGCYTCAGKNDPEKIVLCDECNHGFHMSCLDPPMSELPEEDWYCSACKRDPNGVVAPGAARQARKANKAKGQRDWGRGMACVGKSQTCAMPANHFGPIPGVEVGMAWRFRIQLSESGVHRPPVSGIHGRDVEGAYSLVLSGGYEDDVDNGTEFTYTGSGGRDLSGNKRTADQSSDQTLTRENKALARNCAVKQVSEEGGDAGAAWRDGKPVRVVRSYKMLKHFPEYAPEQGVRYDGIYKVVKYYPESGKSGFRVWKYQLRRDDPNPAPWEPTAKKYPIVFPEGYLEAEAEKRAKKDKGKPKKRVLRESNHSDTESQASSGRQDDSGCESPPMKRRNTRQSKGEEDTPPTKKGRGRPRKSQPASPKSPFSIASKLKPKSSPKSPKQSKTSPQKSPMKSPKSKLESLLAPEELDSIRADDLNSKLWEECLDVCKNKGKQHLINHVRQLFLCIICQDVPASPVTTKCQHNFCMSCLKLAFRSTESRSCPYCRQDMSKEELVHNEPLKTALRTLMPGYDVGKK